MKLLTQTGCDDAGRKPRASIGRLLFRISVCFAAFIFVLAAGCVTAIGTLVQIIFWFGAVVRRSARTIPPAWPEIRGMIQLRTPWEAVAVVLIESALWVLTAHEREMDEPSPWLVRWFALRYEVRCQMHEAHLQSPNTFGKRLHASYKPLRAVTCGYWNH